MTWLLLTKIFPVLDTTPPPAPAFVQAEPGHVEEACWDILCGEDSIGYASNHVATDVGGLVTISSSVRLQQIPIGELLSNLFGGWATPIPESTTFSVQTETQMEFMEGRLEYFESSVATDDMGAMFRLQGQRQASGLRVTVFPEGVLREQGVAEPLFSSVLPVPEDALVVDAFSPYSQLTNLRIGKRWQMRSYRAFPPNQPMRVIDARVERADMILWEGEIVTCFVVSFTDGEGGAPTAAVEPAGLLWVNDDGMILKQDIRVGGVKLSFIRKPAAFCASKELREELP